jgi:proto-oncogene tyrosine-protein kinase ROS
MPDPECLKISRYNGYATQVSSTNMTLTLQLAPWKPPENCPDISWPSVKYTVYYQKTSLADNGTMCDRVSAMCYKKDTYELNVTLTSLEPYTEYMVQVQASNFYTDSPAALLPSNTGYFWTKAGIPSPARDVIVSPYSPTVLSVTWQPPVEARGRLSDIVYDVEWHTHNTNGSRSEDKIAVGRISVRWKRLVGRNNGTPQSTFVTGLKPSHTYVIRVLSYYDEATGFSTSLPVSATTYQSPNEVELLSKSATSLNISWLSSLDDSIFSHSIEYAKVDEEQKWMSGGPVVNTTNATLYIHILTGLLPCTGYSIRVKHVYRSGFVSVWPPSLQSPFLTSADVPAKPDPTWISDAAHGKLVVRWKVPRDNGSPIMQYHLRARLTTGNNWTLVYNGTEPEWSIADKTIEYHQSYVFAVAAQNMIGWGPFSNASSPFVNAQRSRIQSWDQTAVALAASLSILLFLTGIIICILFIICHHRHAESKETVATNGAVSVRNTMDHELATLRELPSVTVQTSNALYGMNAISTALEDVASLKHFHRDQIKLTMFLGSGAFGEVFEGVATDILSENSGCTKVAVKTLHKNASEMEKEEFLQEALLMSNFKHEHILQLLGVCLDNDPQFIILELMEGGDLLSYLRASRPTMTCSQRLTLPDMVNICLDVGKGCEYLEDLHFVHRDLAARNCLISLTDSGHIVKIGDFGLARDIYKNDYYRKEGEGLLPVRWMSPESLIDGVFTTQSDVWAFGVLMWEVLTLGQQPYPARTNTEVLHFVRSGGRLDRPDNCPDDLYHLMLKCWLYVPHTRPSFRYLVQQLTGFSKRSADPLDTFSGRQQLTSGGRASIGHQGSVNTRRPAECPTTSLRSSNGATHRRETHRFSDSFTSVQLQHSRHNRALIEHSRSRSDNSACNISSGYLEPLVCAATVGGNTERTIKYLELLNTTASSMPQVGSMPSKRQGKTSAAARLDYIPLVSSTNDSSRPSVDAGIHCHEPHNCRFSVATIGEESHEGSPDMYATSRDCEMSYVPARAGTNRRHRVWPSPQHYRIRSADCEPVDRNGSTATTSTDFFPLLTNIQFNDKDQHT